MDETAITRVLDMSARVLGSPQPRRVPSDNHTRDEYLRDEAILIAMTSIYETGNNREYLGNS